MVKNGDEVIDALGLSGVDYLGVMASIILCPK